MITHNTLSQIVIESIYTDWGKNKIKQNNNNNDDEKKAVLYTF